MFVLRRFVLVVVSSLATLAGGNYVAAQTVTEEDIVKALLNRPEKADDITGVRGGSLLNLLHGEKGVKKSKTREAAPPSIDLKVNFEFDSIKLENETLLTLDALGVALNNEKIKKQRIAIIGHTDAKGTDDYNAELSKNRAAAVLRYLADNYSIDTDKVVSRGMGKRELLIPDDPYSELNRRVEIRNISRED